MGTKKSNKKLIEQENEQLLAVIASRDLVPSPGTLVPLVVETETGIKSIQYSVAQGLPIVIAFHSSPDKKPSRKNLAKIATFAEVVRTVKMPEGGYRVQLHVQGRVKIIDYKTFSPMIKAQVELVSRPQEIVLTKKDQELIDATKEQFEVLGEYDQNLGELIAVARELVDPGVLSDLIASAITASPADKQRIVAELDEIERISIVSELLNKHLDKVSIRERAAERAEQEMGRAQHEELLREQMRQIQAELGETSDLEMDLVELKKRIKEANLSKEARKEVDAQLKRLQQLHPDASESALARTYIEWILEIPWQKKTKDRIDLDRAKTILDEDHFGLQKTKERILDFLSVKKLKGSKTQGTILLLLGPPGVGKTSLGKSIARALGRKFVRVSVGGLRDEAELRGHRRTYVGALPGRIIQGVKNAGTKNPVFMLDELDKIGSDFRGDPASVLLEVLDPEQNKEFEDHYLNIPYDLSEAMFICTANVDDTIPRPLLDRMEVIDISGYTNQEKVEISKQYLIPQEKDHNGLKKFDVTLSDKSLQHLISGYTRESGVRELRRNISTVFRKSARLVAEGGKPKKIVSPADIEEYLGPVTYVPDDRLQKDDVGVVTGLAWTSVGGETMVIEASITKGKGELQMTGQLGEVMRESAMAALTFVSANAERLGIDPNFQESCRVHIHVPHGAIPKDGPSAGVAMATALVSVLTGKPISKDVAMTGEITLRGNVLEIGGLREKALAALRVGIPRVLIPQANERELKEFPDYLKKEVDFVPVSTLEEVLKFALIERVVKPGDKITLSKTIPKTKPFKSPR